MCRHNVYTILRFSGKSFRILRLLKKKKKKIQSVRVNASDKLNFTVPNT